jgi:predicted  nucleic acid-binding Zn-ribbon protein
MADEITTHILREIRDELRGMRADLSNRIDSTNERIDATNDRMAAMNVGLHERIDGLSQDLAANRDEARATVATFREEVRAGFADVLHVISERERVTDARLTRLEDHAGSPR